MGIGVSYTGANGERKSFSAGSVSALEAAMCSASPHSSAMRGVEAAFAQHSPFSKTEKQASPKSGSAVTKDYRGELCLRGEESDVLVDGVKVYGSLNGKKGFFAVNEIDPSVSGKMVGDWLNIKTQSDASSHDANADDCAFSIPISRTSCEMAGNKLRVKNFYRELMFSREGRLIGVSAETEALVGEFSCGGGSGNGQFAVLPVFSNGVLSAIKFGTEEQLAAAGLTPLTSVNTVETTSNCPLEED